MVMAMIVMVFMAVLVVVMLMVAMIVMVMVRVVMRVRIVMATCMLVAARHCALFGSMDPHAHMRAGDAALLARLCLKNNPGDPHGVQLGQRGRLVRHQLQKGCGQHVTRRAHGTFDI